MSDNRRGPNPEPLLSLMRNQVEAARRAVLAAANPLPVESVALAAALGRVLAEEAVSPEAVPGFDNSAMDGFALRAADLRGARPEAPVALRVVGESRAGHPAEAELGAGEAIRISTGAVVPAGADAVVRVEDTTPGGGETKANDAARGGEARDWVLVHAEVTVGNDIRRAGEDIAAGARVLGPGSRIGPSELGVLASLGLVTVACRRRPRLEVITGGDELIEPDEPLRPGAVRNSNRYTISALAERAGAEVTGTVTVADDPTATRKAIAAALEGDVTVICGGVSVGEHDHVKGALTELGVEEIFWGIALKPGKPTWFGRRGDCLVFGLPGNPVSAMVTFLLLARPALAALVGANPDRPRTQARLGTDYAKRPGRAHAIRCRLELRPEGWWAWPAAAQGSHVLTSMLGADCLALLPSEAGPVEAGDPVEIELLTPHI